MRFNPQKLIPRYSYGIRKVQLRYRGITHQYSYGIGNTLQRYSYGIYGLLQRYSYGTPYIYTRGIGLWGQPSISLVSVNQLNTYQTPSASNNTKGVAPAATNIFTVGRREGYYQGNHDGFYTSRPVPF